MHPLSVNFLGVKMSLIGREELKEYLIQMASLTEEASLDLIRLLAK